MKIALDPTLTPAQNAQAYFKKYRKQKKITQEQLAQITNLSYGYIKNLEAPNVYATISIETLNLIAKALDTTIIHLLSE